MYLKTLCVWTAVIGSNFILLLGYIRHLRTIFIPPTPPQKHIIVHWLAQNSKKNIYELKCQGSLVSPCSCYGCKFVNLPFYNVFYIILIVLYYYILAIYMYICHSLECENTRNGTALGKWYRIGSCYCILGVETLFRSVKRSEERNIRFSRSLGRGPFTISFRFPFTSV